MGILSSEELFGNQKRVVSSKELFGMSIPEEKKSFVQTPVEDANWTAFKDVVKNAPRMAVDISDKLVSGATMGLSDKAAQAGDWLSEKLTGIKTEQLPKDENYVPPNKYVETGAEFLGAAVPIGVAGNIIAKPIAKKLTTIATQKLPAAMIKYMPALANVLGWSVTGTIYDTSSKIISEGELPTAKEAATSGLIWGALEVGLGTAGWAGRTALAVNRFAKEASINRTLALDIIMKLAKKDGRPLAEIANNKALFHELKSAVVEMPESKIGQPLIMPKDYTGGKSPIPERLKTTVLEGETPLPDKEVPLRPDQRAALAQKNWLAEEANIPMRELTPEEVFKQNMERSNKEGLSAAQGQRNIQAELDKKLTGNKYLDKLTITPTASKPAKQTSPEAPTSDFSTQTGKGKPERTASDFISDLNTTFQGKAGLSVKDVALTEKQNAAMERVIQDAKKAGKEISVYMKDLGLTPEASANLLERYGKQKSVAQVAKEPVAKDSEKTITHYSQPKGKIVKETLTNLDNAFGVVSTRLGNVATELKDKVKMHAAEKAIKTKNTIDEITPFYKKFDKLSEKEQLEIHGLLDNGQYKPELREQGLKLLKEKGMLAEFLKADAATYKKLFREFIESGGKSNEVSKNYISRHVKDYPGLRESLGKENIGKIDEAFAKEAQKKGVTVEELGDEAKGAIIDSMMRGWSKNKIFLFDPFEVKTGIGRSRSLNILTTEQLSKYYPLHESMLKYAENMNAAIANNNLFNKTRTIGKAVREQWLEDIDVPDKARTNDSIGDIILDLKNKGKFSKDPNKAMEQEAEVKHVLTSYMMPKSQGKYVTGLKNFTYNALLGNIETALTQFQDVGVTLSRHGIRNTLQGLSRMPTEKAYKLGDIGIDNFKADLERNTKMGKVTKINMAPLSALDMFGKGLNMNANLVKTQRALKNPKYKPEIEVEINRLFGEDAAQVKQDLLNGKKTMATNSYVHYNLAKHHPISTAEVPTGYLNSDKGRLLYMLHTYQIKQLDIYRNDVLNELKAGNIMKGAYNFASLTSWLLASGVAVKTVSDFIFKGETKDFSEYLINSAWQLTLVNRYLADKGFREGVGSFLWEGVAPGTVSIANDISKDLKDIIEGNDEKGLRSTKFLPLLGKPYYDRFGRGSE